MFYLKKIVGLNFITESNDVPTDNFRLVIPFDFLKRGVDVHYACRGCRKIYKTFSGLAMHEIHCSHANFRVISIDAKESNKLEQDRQREKLKILEDENMRLKEDDLVLNNRIRELEEENQRLRRGTTNNEVEVLKRALAEKEKQVRSYEDLLRFAISNGKSITTINNNLVINNILQEKGKDYFEGCKKLIDKYTNIQEINSSNLSPFKRMLQEIKTIETDDAKIVSSILNPPPTLEDDFYEALQSYQREKLEEVKKQSELVGDKNTSVKITELLTYD